MKFNWLSYNCEAAQLHVSQSPRGIFIDLCKQGIWRVNHYILLDELEYKETKVVDLQR